MTSGYVAKLPTHVYRKTLLRVIVHCSVQPREFSVAPRQAPVSSLHPPRARATLPFPRILVTTALRAPPTPLLLALQSQLGQHRPSHSPPTILSLLVPGRIAMPPLQASRHPYSVVISRLEAVLELWLVEKLTS